MKWPTKSRSLRRVYRRTPGGRTVIHLRQRKHSPAVCAQCARLLPSVRHKGAKSEKRPARPFAGYYCSVCMRRALIGKVRP